MKKILSLLMSVLFILSLFTGCDNTGEVNSADMASAETAEPSQDTEDTDVGNDQSPAEDPLAVSLPLVEETETFTMLYPFFPLLSTYMASLEDNSVIKKMEELTNIHLEIEDASLLTFADTLNIYINSGALPDIVFNFGRYYTQGMENAVEEEIIVDLAQYSQFLPNYYYQLESTDMFKDLMTDSGALPAAYFISEDAIISYGLITREDWLDELELSAPVTIDEFYEMLTAMKTEYGSQMWLGSLGSTACNAVASAYGVSSYDGGTIGDYFIQKDGTVVYSPLEDGFKDYIATMSRWYSEGLIYTDFMTGETQAPPTELLTSTDFSVWSGNKSIIGMLETYAGDESVSELAIAAPRVNADDILHVSAVNEKFDLTGMVVSTNCENIELLCRWLDYWYTEDGSMMVSWGIEGESYELDEKNEPYFTDYVLNNPDGIDSTTMFSMVCLSGAPGIKSVDSQMAILTDKQRDAVEVWGENYDAAYMYPTGARMNAEELAHFNSTYSDIKTYVSEYTLNFITGNIDYEAEWDTFIETIKSLDIESCIADKQNALDRYNQRG